MSLTNFRNYLRLEWDLSPQLMVIQGDNAQGKTNLLEAFCVLATTRSLRAESDGELINWQARQEPLGAARLWAEVKRASGQLHVEVALQGQKPPLARDESPPNPQSPWPARKRIRINGVVRRAIDLIGQINVVMFNSQDIDLIGGPPALRRRFLDFTISQADHHYLRSLQRYQNILLQRNHLLRLIGEGQAHREELNFWNEALIEVGSHLISRRHSLVSTLRGVARYTHLQLSGQEELDILYQPRLNKGNIQVLAQSLLQDVEGVRDSLRQGLQEAAKEEIRLGVSMVGPHRDDLQFLVNGIDAGCYASRGQRRTIALSLRLAEAKVLANQLGDSPVLLLDDAFSELDARRRHHLQEATSHYDQVLITTTDWDRLEPQVLAQAAKFQIREGKLEAV